MRTLACARGDEAPRMRGGSPRWQWRRPVTERARESSAGPVRRVCVVDDDEGIRDTLRYLLEDAGYAVEEAAGGGAALRLLDDTPLPRVMLLDRMMPRVDGVAILRALAERPEIARRTAILFMTARSDPPDAEMARVIAASTIGTVAKPFDLDALLAAVERASRLLAARIAAE
jgi:CheY-like chemotaxis protein